MRTVILTSVSAIALALSCAPTALAQTSSRPAASDTAIEELVVTARRREERLRDIPAVGTVLDQQAIAERGGMVTLSDLAQALPSVNFANTTTPQTAEVTMRGSGSARATTAEAGVGLYRNGTYIGGGRLGGRTFTRMDFFDAERVEVLRGVQSALYGRNAIGGTLNLISQQPKFDQDGWAKVKAGSKQLYEGQLVENLTLGEHLALRLGVDYQDQAKGFFYNHVQDRYFDEQHAEGFRGQLRFRWNALDTNLLFERSFAHLPALNFQLYILPGSLAAFPHGAIQPQYDYGWNGPMGAKQNERSFIWNSSLDLNWAKLSWVGSYRKRDTWHQFDNDAVDPVFLAALQKQGDGLAVDPNTHTVQFDGTTNRYFEAHLNDNGASPVRWLVGVEHLEIASFANFVNLRTPTKANPSPGTYSPSQLDTTSNALFGSAGYDVTQQLNLTVEGRYSRERKSLVANRYDLVTNASQGARFAITSGMVESHTSYTGTASYKLPWHHALAYAKAGSGFRAGGFNTDLGDPRAPNPVTAVYQPEISKAYELGLKGDLTPNVFATLSLYQTNTKGVLVQASNGCSAALPSCPVAATGFLRNAGDSRNQGAELELNGRFALAGGRLRLDGAVTRIKADIISGPDKGFKVPQVPDWVITAGMNYSHEIVGGANGFVNLQYYSRTGGVQEEIQTPTLVDYDKWDLRLGARKAGWEVAAYVNNLADTRYLVYSAATTRRWNTPRNLGVEISKRW